MNKIMLEMFCWFIYFFLFYHIQIPSFVKLAVKFWLHCSKLPSLIDFSLLLLSNPNSWPWLRKACVIWRLLAPLNLSSSIHLVLSTLASSVPQMFGPSTTLGFVVHSLHLGCSSSSSSCGSSSHWFQLKFRPCKSLTLFLMFNRR